MSATATIERRVTVHICQRCQHDWLPRLKRKPAVCPVCKSRDWATPRKKAAK